VSYRQYPARSNHPSEEFFRLKKVQAKKKRDAAEAEAKRKEANAGAERHKDDGIGGGAAGGADMLDSKDEDVIF
jgi:V-type H+-transporting ATPase subunit D